MFLPAFLVLGNCLALAPLPQPHLNLPAGEGTAEWYESRPAHADLHGDPLPEGAMARIGTDRFLHDNTVLAVAFSPDGRHLAAAGHEAVRLSDAVTGRALVRFTARVASFNQVAFLPRSKFLVTQSYEGHILFWELTPGQRRPLRGPTTEKYSRFALAPDGKHLAFVREGAIRLWDVRSGEEVGRLGGQERYYWLAFSSDGKLLASQSSEGVALWDVPSGKAVRRFPPSEGGEDPKPFGPRRGPVLIKCALSADGTILAGLMRDDLRSQYAVHVWETATGKALPVLQVRDTPPQAMAVSAGGDRVAVVGQHGLQVWDVRTGASRCHVSVSGQPFSVGFSPDGRVVAAGLVCRVKMWETETGRERWPVSEHRDPIGFVALSPDGRTVVTAALPAGGPPVPGGEREAPGLRYWEAATGRRLPSPKGERRFPPFACLSADQRTLATQGEEGVQVWDVESGDKLCQLPPKLRPEVSALFRRRQVTGRRFPRGPSPPGHPRPPGTVGRSCGQTPGGVCGP